MSGTIAIIAVFGGLVFFHELGHFAMARFFKMGVQTFSLGFGPALYATKRGSTRYQIAAFPLGGFVSLVGETSEDDLPEGFSKEESFSLRPAWQRFLVILAGPIFNLVLAWLLCWGLLYTNGQHELLPVIGVFSEKSPAREAGLRVGDSIRTINGMPVERWEEIAPLVQKSKGSTLTVVAARLPEGADQSDSPASNAPLPATGSEAGQNTPAKAESIETVTFSFEPVRITQTNFFGEKLENWIMGVSPRGDLRPVAFGFIEAASGGVREAGNMVLLTWKVLTGLLRGNVAADTVGGPIGIGKAIYEQAGIGLANVVFVAAFISVNLGIMNLLPIPVLDGGHLVFLSIEMLFRRAVPDYFREKAAMIGLGLLLGLMFFATYNDIVRLFE